MPTYPASPTPSYPVTRELRFSTHIATGYNGTEQRWQQAHGEESWALNYERLTLEQRDTLLAFFQSSQGAYAADIDFAWGGTTYNNCSFADDNFTATETANGIWTASVRLTQDVRPQETGTLDATFPALASGHVAQLPFTHGRSYDTVVVRTEGGRFAYPKRAIQRAWSVGGTSLSNADAQALWDTFRLARGRYGKFAYTDTDSATEYTSCRFASDSLTWTAIGPDQNSIAAQIQTYI